MAMQEFEAQPAPFQTVARPADGEKVSANPPCFVYPAVKCHDAYVVEYSQSANFPVDATTVLAGAWMLNVPEHALLPGGWHWRWRPGRVGDKDPVLWSDVRSFLVPPDVPTVLFPRINDLVSRIGVLHPRVLVSASELEGVRARARQWNGSAWPESVTRYATRAQNKKLLPEPDFLPARKEPQYLGLYQQAFRTYRPFFGEMSHLAENYLLSGDALSGQEAKRRLLHIVGWDPAGSTQLSHNDELATEVVRHCPKVYDWIYPLLTDAEQKRCLACFRVRMEEMFRVLTGRPFEKRPYASHVMGYYLPDLLQACLAVSGDLSVDTMLHYTLMQLWSPFFPPYGDADGGWNEGPGYWGWMAGVCARMYVLVERATGIPVHLRSHLRNQAYYKLYANPHWFQMSPFGDGQESPARHGMVLGMLASLYDNPYAKWGAEASGARMTGLSALLFPTDDVDARPPLDLPQGRCFRDVGLACSHTCLADGTSDVAFLLRSCPFGGISHAYADQNTFILDAFGEPLIISSGYYQLYGHPHHAEWTRQTAASNSLLVNGKGQPWSWDAKGRVADFVTTAAADYTVGAASDAYPEVLTRYDRRVLFLRPMHTGGEALIVVCDEIEAVEPSTYQFLLHALEKMTVDEPRQSVTIQRGKAACRIDFLAPAGLSFEQDDQFPKPPVRTAPNQWHLRA
ncbi:MAG: DUF4962 domain-containing protein, partial [Lentisphaeria bacterium]|nr:DUF4962 domain-containing protein [Lentisphaeria bacterium]